MRVMIGFRLYLYLMAIALVMAFRDNSDYIHCVHTYVIMVGIARLIYVRR